MGIQREFIGGVFETKYSIDFLITQLVKQLPTVVIPACLVVVCHAIAVDDMITYSFLSSLLQLTQFHQDHHHTHIVWFPQEYY